MESVFSKVFLCPIGNRQTLPFLRTDCFRQAFAVAKVDDQFIRAVRGIGVVIESHDLDQSLNELHGVLAPAISGTKFATFVAPYSPMVQCVLALRAGSAVEFGGRIDAGFELPVELPVATELSIGQILDQAWKTSSGTVRFGNNSDPQWIPNWRNRGRLGTRLAVG